MAALDQFLGVSYKLTTSENFDELMKELATDPALRSQLLEMLPKTENSSHFAPAELIGVGLVTRKLGNTVSPTIVLSKEDDLYTLKTLSTFKNSSISFKLGEEFEEETPDGRKVKATVTVDGTTMNHVQEGDKKTVIVREFSPDKVVAKMTVNSITCTRTYERV